MARDGLLIGQVAAQSGVSRKALRLYEAAGILPPSRRTTAGYRVYGGDTLSILTFVTRARRLGFRLDEIKDVVQMRRSGRCPCPHVLELVRDKVADLDRTSPISPSSAAGFASCSSPLAHHAAARPRSAITSSAWRS